MRPGASTLTAASSRRSPRRSVGGPPPRLGRADALGQARAIDALYRAAATGTTVTPT